MLLLPETSYNHKKHINTGMKFFSLSTRQDTVILIMSALFSLEDHGPKGRLWNLPKVMPRSFCGSSCRTLPLRARGTSGHAWWKPTPVLAMWWRGMGAWRVAEKVTLRPSSKSQALLLSQGKHFIWGRDDILFSLECLPRLAFLKYEG